MGGVCWWRDHLQGLYHTVGTGILTPLDVSLRQRLTCYTYVHLFIIDLFIYLFTLLLKILFGLSLL